MSDDLEKRIRDFEAEGAAAADKVAQTIRTITASAPKSAQVPRAELRNTMLEALVYGDNDLVGLVAYAMHEVNRRDWSTAYEAANGRPPSDGEVRAYLVGEQLERRLDTYRRLAEDSLAKIAVGDPSFRSLVTAPEQPVAETARATPRTAPQTVQPAPVAAPAKVAAISPAPARTAPAPLAAERDAPPRRKGRTGALIAYLLVLLIAVVGVAYVLRFGIDIGGLQK